MHNASTAAKQQKRTVYKPFRLSNSNKNRFIFYIMSIVIRELPPEEITPIVINDLDTENQPDVYESFFPVLQQIPIAISLVITYIVEYILTVINIVYGPIQRQYGLNAWDPRLSATATLCRASSSHRVDAP
jgi:hypothetical protein